MKISKELYRVTLLGVVLSSAFISPAQSQEIIVEEGQTLSEIAEQYLGSAAQWTEICEANRAALDGNCHLIHPGLELTLPDGTAGGVVTLTELPEDGASVTELGDPAPEADAGSEEIDEPVADETEEVIPADVSPDDATVTPPVAPTDGATEAMLTALSPNNATVTDLDETVDGLAVKQVVTDEGEGHHRVRYSLAELGSEAYTVRWIVRFDTAEAVNLLVFDDENRTYARVHLSRTDDGVEIANQSGVDSPTVTDLGDDWYELTYSFTGRPSEGMTQLLVYPTADLMADLPSYTLSMTDPIVTLADQG